MNKTVLVIGIIFLLVGISINPAVAVLNSNDDTTPPVSTHTLDPLKPDGCNGWYVSDVNVTLTAVDYMSGVKEILYRVNDEQIQTFTGDNGTFILDIEGENHFIEYWAIDNAGNEEIPHHTFTIDIDKTNPDIDLIYGWRGNQLFGWTLYFTATCSDSTSGMERVEFYLNDELQETVYGPGPYYEWSWNYRYTGEFNVRGLICGREITDEYVKFYALIVIVTPIEDWEQPFDVYAYAYDKAGNRGSDSILDPCYLETIEPGIYLFQSLTLPNNYTGKIGLFYIDAIFDIN